MNVFLSNSNRKKETFKKKTNELIYITVTFIFYKINEGKIRQRIVSEHVYMIKFL